MRGFRARIDLRDTLIRYIEEGQSKFVVDMSRAESLDSAAEIFGDEKEAAARSR